MKVAVFNAKGGVGRTTTALNLLAAIARRGQRPCGVDLDPRAQLSAMFGVGARRVEDSVHACLVDGVPLAHVAQIARSGVAIAPGHHALGNIESLVGKGLAGLKRLDVALGAGQGEASSIVIDCPPLLNVLSLNALFACELVVVPISADYLALRAAQDLERALKALEPVMKRRLPRRYLLTRFAPESRMAQEVAAQLADSLPVEEICTARIRESLEVAQSPLAGLDVFRHAPDSAGAHDYETLLDNLVAAGGQP